MALRAGQLWGRRGCGLAGACACDVLADFECDWGSNVESIVECDVKFEFPVVGMFLLSIGPDHLYNSAMNYAQRLTPKLSVRFPLTTLRSMISAFNLSSTCASRSGIGAL